MKPLPFTYIDSKLPDGNTQRVYIYYMNGLQYITPFVRHAYNRTK